MQEILDLITQSNKYAAAKGNLVNIHVLEKVAKWITSMLKTFGVADNGAEIGFGSTNNDGAANVSPSNTLGGSPHHHRWPINSHENNPIDGW
jgi:hypothetical protein